MQEQKIGVVYRKSDYPGLVTRILIDVIDISAIVLIAIGSFMTVLSSIENSETIGRLICSFITLGLFYMGPMKATRIPTLGYLLFKVKLVNIAGHPAGFWQTTGRMCFMFLGPINYILDLLWLYGESPRQALRDRFSGTFLVKKNAVIEYEGKVMTRVLHTMGYRTQIEEVEKPGPVAARANIGQNV